MRSDRIVRIALTLVFLGALLAPGASGANNCADGGRPRPDEGGIGGTGARPSTPDEDDSGIGGTGVHADDDRGIIGTITGFASICVGGTEIHYDDKTAIEIDGRPASVAELAVGEVVEVIAHGIGDEVRARQIAVPRILSGPITSVGAGEIEVMGQRVQITATTGSDLTTTGNGAAELVAGTFVRISGFRRDDGVIEASRLVPVERSDTVTMSGPITRTDAGAFRIAGTTVKAGVPSTIAAGREVRVTGTWDGHAVVASSIEPRPELPFDGAIARLQIEGIVGRTSSGIVTIGSLRVKFDGDSGTAAVTGERVRVDATLRDGHVVGDRINVMGERPSQMPRRELERQSGHPHPAPGGEQPHGSDGAVPNDNPGAAEGHRVAPEGARPNRDGVPQRPDVRADRPERPDAPQRPERPERPQPPERPQLPDRNFRPERPDRPPLPERPR